MSWIDGYKQKRCSAAEAVSSIQSGQSVYIGSNAATPFVLVNALADRKDALNDVTVSHVLLLGDDPLSQPGMENHFRNNSLFVGPGDRVAVNEGRADYIPIFLYEIPGLFTSGKIPLDTAMIQLSPPDEHGFMSFGVECLASRGAVDSATTVIAQINEKMPRTLGDSFIHVSRISKFVETDEKLPVLAPKPFTDVEEKIGAYIAGLVEDGSTLQLGIGGIPNAALKCMFDKKNLGVHTEMVSDSIVEAIDAGVINGRKKTLHPGKIIATFYFGSQELYDYIDDNPIFETHPTNYTNHPFIIGQNENLVAINSAIEVDLTGQVCSDSIGTQIYSGFGGQVDFIRGAAQSKNGKPIIALPSSAKKGTISKIVPTLKRGAGVVTTRADVHYVVTEYGVAYLHGKNLRERAEALINIAHPSARQTLEDEAKQRKLL